jgi:hypothetical protein
MTRSREKVLEPALLALPVGRAAVALVKRVGVRSRRLRFAQRGRTFYPGCEDAPLELILGNTERRRRFATEPHRRDLATPDLAVDRVAVQPQPTRDSGIVSSGAGLVVVTDIYRRLSARRWR